MTGAAGGALTGSGIDLALGGGSLMLGSAIGAVLGGPGAAFGFGKVAQMKVLGQPLGNKTLQAGPLKDKNLPVILLRRALYFTVEIAERPHADRSKIVLEDETLLQNDPLDTETKKVLEKLHRKFTSGNAVSEDLLRQYAKEVYSLLLERIEH